MSVVIKCGCGLRVVTGNAAVYSCVFSGHAKVKEETIEITFHESVDRFCNEIYCNESKLSVETALKQAQKLIC